MYTCVLYVLCLSIYIIYITYTPYLGLGIAVFVREREQGRFRGSTEGAQREHRGSTEGAQGSKEYHGSIRA